MKFDGTQFGKEIVATVKDFVSERLSPILTRLDAIEARAPEKGEKGADGAPGEKGEPGEAAPAPTREQIVEAIMSMPDVLDEAVQRYLADNPPAAGKDGADGRDGKDGAPGADGKDGADGRDGVGLAGAVIDRDGNLILTMTDGGTKDMGLVVGKDGAKGENGRDGFSLEDFDASLMEDGRTVLLSFEQKEHTDKIMLSFPAAIYRGVFKEGDAYVRGDMVTFGGSVWHCDKDTTAKPGEAVAGWTLAVKRGRDGKAGKDGGVEKKPEPIKLGGKS